MPDIEKLSIKLLGPLKISLKSGGDLALSGQKPQALLAYLAAHAGQSIPREKLMALLWGDRLDAQARQSLRECLSRLRKTLGQSASHALLSDRNSVTLDAKSVDTDLRRLSEFTSDEGAAELSQVADLYRGDFLEGFTAREAPFDNWLRDERTRYRDLMCEALARLTARQEAADAYDGVLVSARRLLTLDPLREDAHRAIMRAHANSGKQGAALQQYQDCIDALQEELNVRPEDETRLLAGRIRGGVSADKVSKSIAPTRATEAARGRKLKIAVLPFSGMTGDGENDYFVNGINEDIVTALTRNRWLSVMGHNTTMVLKGRREDMLVAAREFGARYVVDGSVRRAGRRVRITAQLIEAESGENVWAERYDRDLEDIFSVQDDITKTITATIEPELAAKEAQRVQGTATENLDAWDCYHLGLSHMYKFTKPDNAKAQELFRRAMDIDPGYAIAYARLSYAKVMSVVYFEADATPALLDEAVELAERATQLDDLDAVGQFALGRAHLIRGEYDHSIAAFETALTLNPCLAHNHCGLGDTMAYRGDPAGSLEYFEEAVHLSPHDPYRWAFLMYGSMAYLFLHRHEEAVEWAGAASRVPNSHYWATAALVSALGHLDRAEEATTARGKLLAQYPGFTCGFARERLFYIREPQQIEHYIDGLVKAGIAT